MIVRFKKLKDKHDFLKKFIKCNDNNNVRVREVTTMDSDLQITLSVRDDNIGYVRMPNEYKKVKPIMIDKDHIGDWKSKYEG